MRPVTVTGNCSSCGPCAPAGWSSTATACCITGSRTELATCGANSLDHELIAVAGGRDVFADRADDGSEVDLDALASRNPEAIIYVRYVDADLNASAGGTAIASLGLSGARILVLDPQLGARAGPRTATALLAVAHFLHPGLFP